MSLPLLYRRVLKTNRVLPPDLRRLGNGYAREEFRRHLTAEATWVRVFVAEWSRYCEALEAGERGRALAEEERRTLSDQQLQQLALLRRESSRGLRGEPQSEAEDEPAPHVHGPGCRH